MIATVNLLPYRPARRLKKAYLILASWGGTAILTAGILLLVHLQFTSLLDERNALEKQNEQTIAELDKQLGEVKNIRDIKLIIETKLKIIQELKQARNLPVRLIDTIIHALPEKAWLKDITTQGQTLKLKGMAQSNAVVAMFMNNLSASPLISGVKLDQVALNTGTSAIKAFSLEAQFGPKSDTPPGTNAAPNTTASPKPANPKPEGDAQKKGGH